MKDITEKLREYISKNFHKMYLGIENKPQMWEIKKLAQGEYNINYTLKSGDRKIVLRLNTGSQMNIENQIEYEYNALFSLKNSKRTPVPYFCENFVSELGYGFLAMEFLEGSPLDYSKDLKIAGDCLADIHSTEIVQNKLISVKNPKEDMLKECKNLLEKYAESKYCDRKKLKKLNQMFDMLTELAAVKEKTVKCCINTELNSGNFIVSKDKFCNLVDWEKPVFADPAQDLGHFLSPTTTLWKTEHILTNEQITQFIDDYKKSVGTRYDTIGIEKRTLDYIRLNCMRGLSWCAMAYAEYQNPEKLIQNEDTRSKLQMYMSDEFLDFINEEYIKR